MGNVIPGRWWVDAQGNFGPEGWPMVGNLFVIGKAHASGEVVSQSGWLVSDGSGFIGFQGSIGSGERIQWRLKHDLKSVQRFFGKMTRL